MNRIARTRIQRSPIAVDLREAGAEVLPFDDERFDCVVSTWTLCSIRAVSNAIAEIYRVLRPGGRFVFIEHGQSGDARIQRWQRRLNPIQRRLGGGCRLDLDVQRELATQPFCSVEFECFEMERMPRTHGTMYQGAAFK
jgi:ubiquinone/menaquinone biosynthesis C-methylase UbiE